MSQQKQQETVFLGTSLVEKPKDIIDAISQIQQYYTLEKGGTPISSDFLTLEGSLDLFSVGLRAAIKNGLFSAITSPFMIGAFRKYFPVFGGEAGLYDKIWTIIVNYSLTICYAIMLSHVTRYYIGDITRSAIRSLFSGIIAGAIITTMFVFILYHTLYYFVLTPQNVTSFLLKFKGWISYEALEGIYTFIFYFSKTLILSSWALVINMIIMLSVPVIFLVFKAKKANKELINRNKWQIGV